MTADRSRIADLLSSACGGSEDVEPNTSEWDAERYAEHVHERVGAIVKFIFEAMPNAEHLGQPYGDAFDAIEAALHQLSQRDDILARLVDAGIVTESLLEDIEAKLDAETQP